MTRSVAAVLLFLATPLAAAEPDPLHGELDTRSGMGGTSDPLATDGPALGAYGAALVVEDGRIFVGAPGEVELFPMPPNRPGAVVILERTADGWREAARVRGSGSSIGDGFGAALAVDGSTLVVGAPKTANGKGAVYIFTRSAAGWTQTLRLENVDGQEGDRFGAAVAVAEDRILVGAPGHEDGLGAVYAFRRDGTGWMGRHDRLAGTEPGGRFGSALSASGSRVAVGAPGPFPSLIPTGDQAPDLRTGAVHVMEWASGGWQRGPALVGLEGGPGLFGTAVVLRDDELFASAPFAPPGGVILRYARSADGWRVADTLRTDVMRPSGLGMSLALAGDDLWAGAPIGGQTGAGIAAWVFSPAADGGYSGTKVPGPDSEIGFFGGAIGAEGDLAVIGAPGEDILEGALHVYARRAGEWTEVRTLTDESSGAVAITGGPVSCQGGEARGYGCADVDLVAFLPVSALGGKRGVIVNDLWGWTDPRTGREYGIVGRTDGTVFVDVTDAANPRILGELPLHEGAKPNLWRDMKVYADHVFIVADAAGEHGMQVFDLRKLRDARPGTIFTEDAHYDGIHSAHNIVMNEEAGLAAVVGSSGGGSTCGGGLHMVDVRDPLNPVFAGCFADASTGFGSGYSHDAQCVTYHGPDEQFRGHEVCLGSNGNALSIADVTDRENPVALAAATYPRSGFLHQGWFSDDHRYFYMNDETDEVAGLVDRTRTLVWDLAELDDPILVKEHLGTNAASDHNLYVRGDLMYQSNYVSGLRILDISDPENPKEVGFFDTVTAGEDVPGFAGSWSNYPFFRSGNILVSSMREGLFILKKRTTVF